MNDIKNLGALGFEFPSPLYLLGSLLFGLVGYVAFRRGRKAQRPELTWTGVALMIYPYVVSQTWLLWLTGAILCVWLYAKWE